MDGMDDMDDMDDMDGKRGAYARNPEFLGQAFSLYCKGMSCLKICEVLRVEWPEAAERTVGRIAQTHGWEAARAGYLRLLAEAQASAEGLVPEAILQLQRLRVTLEGRLPTLNYQEMNQYRGVLDDLLMYTGKHPRLKADASVVVAVGDDGELKAFLEVLQGDEVVGPALRKRRAVIEREWRRRLADRSSDTKTQRKAGEKQEKSKGQSLDAKAQRAQRGAKKSTSQSKSESIGKSEKLSTSTSKSSYAKALGRAEKKVGR